jgi:hypothetical protein
MTKREKINKIRQLLSIHQRPETDLKSWTDQDLRALAAIQEKYKGRLKHLKETDLTKQEFETLETLTDKYFNHANKKTKDK